MGESDFQQWKSIAFVASLVTVAVVERLAPWRRFRGTGSGALRNVLLAGVDFAVLAVVCAGCSCAASRWASRNGIGLFNVVAAPGGLSAAVTILAFDALSWVWHRATHVVPFLWRFHAVHHSDPAFDATTSFRFHPGELVLSLPARIALVLALGPPVVAILVFEMVFGFFNLFVHGNLRLPRAVESAMETVFVHPALHRVHHSRVLDESNRNFGTIFSIWDRLFGTLLPSRSGRDVGIGLASVPAEQVAGLLGQLRLPAWPPGNP